MPVPLLPMIATTSPASMVRESQRNTSGLATEPVLNPLARSSAARRGIASYFLFVSLTDLLPACFIVLQGWLGNFESDAEQRRLGSKRSSDVSGAASRSKSRRLENFPYSATRIGAHELSCRPLGMNSAKVEFKCQQPHSFLSRYSLANALWADSLATQHSVCATVSRLEGTPAAWG